MSEPTGATDHESTTPTLPDLDLLTIGELEPRARARLPEQVYDYAAGGSASETTLRRNRTALESIALEQRVLVDVREIDLRVPFLGLDLPLPVIVAPIGGLVQFHPEGDLEMARGVGATGVLSTVSGAVGWPIEDVAAHASGPLMFQLYHFGDRSWVGDRLDVVRAAGFHSVCLTVDLAVLSRRDRDIERRYAPREELRRAPNPPPPDRTYPARLTWDDASWIRDRVQLPFGLKGIMTAPDAVRAVEVGADFIWVSNHGGRQLDDGRATIDVLPEIADAVQGRAALIVDGGFSRGTDVMKGIALGADLVGLGRVPLWGFAVGGGRGAARAIELIREELLVAMALSGNTSISSLDHDAIRHLGRSTTT
jgi:glycolate oxidase